MYFSSQTLKLGYGPARWFGHVKRIPQESLQPAGIAPTGKRPRGRPRTMWRDYISDLKYIKTMAAFHVMLPKAKADLKSEEYTQLHQDVAVFTK